MIDMTGKYQTRDGRPARILCVDACPGRYPVIALTDGSGEPRTYTLEGIFSVSQGRSDADLIPVPIPPQLVPLGPEDVIVNTSLLSGSTGAVATILSANDQACIYAGWDDHGQPELFSPRWSELKECGVTYSKSGDDVFVPCSKPA